MKSRPFVVQSSQIAMNWVEQLIDLQADALRMSFNDMQSFLKDKGTRPLKWQMKHSSSLFADPWSMFGPRWRLLRNSKSLS